MTKFSFYVGILPEDHSRLLDFVYSLNEDSDEKFHCEIMDEYDNPYGYYTFVLTGTLDAYKCFLNTHDTPNFVKSLNHYEE